MRFEKHARTSRIKFVILFEFQSLNKVVKNLINKYLYL